MLWVKPPPSMLEKLPRLFIILLVMNKTKGVVKPSPMAPIKPKTIKNQSWISACMKMDLMEPFFFFFFLTMATLLLWFTSISHTHTHNNNTPSPQKQPNSDHKEWLLLLPSLKQWPHYSGGLMTYDTAMLSWIYRNQWVRG